MKNKSITAQEFDNLFEEGGDIIDFLDLDNASRPDMQARRVSVDFPAWMVQELDKEAHLLGITRQSVIKFWISEKLRSTK